MGHCSVWIRWETEDDPYNVKYDLPKDRDVNPYLVYREYWERKPKKKTKLGRGTRLKRVLRYVNLYATWIFYEINFIGSSVNLK